MSIIRRGHRSPPSGASGLPPHLVVVVCLMTASTAPSVVQGQVHHQAAAPVQSFDSLEVLVAQAAASHPEVEAALRRVEAARARVPQAGALPDPMVSAGLENLPLSSFSLSDDGMTMLSLHLEQRLPPRGLRAAREAAARSEVEAAVAEVEVARWQVATRLREAWFQLLLVGRAEEVHHRTHATLEAFARTAESAYTQGLAPQADILRAQTELAAIHEHLSELRQRRSAALAEVNALLGRPTRSPLTAAPPPRLVALLKADPDPGFLSMSLATPELGGGFPTLVELEARAVETRPEVALAHHRIQAAQHRQEAAVRDRRPGISLSGGYGIRSARSDMFSLGVSIDLPVFRSRKQDQAVMEAEEVRLAGELDLEAVIRRIRREVADAHADLVRSRERLLLLDEAVIPQSRAAVESAAAAYRSGDADFSSLMQAQAALFRYEIQLAHLAAEVGQELARLERAVGARLTREDPQ